MADRRSFALRLELPGPPAAVPVDGLRINVAALLVPSVGDRMAETVGMVLLELVENAVKYGDWTQDGARALSISVEADARLAKVSVVNPAPAGEEHRRALDATLLRIATAPTARTAFLERLSTIAERREPGFVSRIGLARIAYEGCGLLTVASPASDRIEVTADIDLERMVD